MRVALAQTTTGIDPDANGRALVAQIGEAAAAGAAMLFTPEMSGLLDRDRARASPHLRWEEEDRVLSAVRAAAAEHGLWVAIGSMAFRAPGPLERLVNRSLVIGPDGRIVARYDKMHLFDVDLPTGESWRESTSFAAGSRAAVVETPVGRLGLSICYDLRFPSLYQQLSAAGATVLAVPAAFTVPTGEAHWHVLLRARAIENAAWVIAAAQTGRHEDGRSTYGHSLVVSPWGEIMLDMGAEAGLGFAEIGAEGVSEVRRRIPVIDHRRSVPAAELLS